MKLSRILSSLALATATLSATAASAAPDYLTGYVGYFDVIRQNHDTTQFGLEYRARPIEYGFRPMVGINATADSSVYGYVGFNWDVALLDKKLYLIPNFAVGAYKKGDSKDLGGPIEFRSGIELAYEMGNQHRLGVAFNHISNASIYKHNPGSETVLVNYSIPVDSLISR